MSITLFITMLTIGSAICTLITEAVKKAFQNAHKEVSPNLVALINAVFIGALGTAVCYIILGIPFTINNIICLILMSVAVWVGSMIGFDKVKQLLEQLVKEQNNESGR